MRALNLLHYPSLARQRRIFHRCWSGLAGLFMGATVAWAWLHWQDMQTVRLLQEKNILQANLAKRTAQKQEAQSLQTQWKLQAEQLAHLKRVARHQQAWVTLHESLQAQASQRGVSLARLQAEAEKIEFQGTGAHMQAISLAQQELSDRLDAALSLTSFTAGAREGVDFVWQAAWPDVAPSTTASGLRP